MHITLDVLHSHRFPAHGSLTLDWEPRFLHTQIRGPNNVEMVDQGLKLMIETGRPMWPADGRVVELVQWYDSMMMSPEAFARYEHLVDRLAANGFRPAATLVVVAPEVEGRWLMLPRVLAMFQRSRPAQAWETLEPALAQVQALLASWPSAESSGAPADQLRGPAAPR